MKTQTRTRITIQTRQTIVVHSQAGCRTWCERCLDEVVALPAESVAQLLQVSLVSLLGLIENGKLHAVEVVAELPMVCFNSLATGVSHTQIQIEGERQ